MKTIKTKLFVALSSMSFFVSSNAAQFYSLSSNLVLVDHDGYLKNKGLDESHLIVLDSDFDEKKFSLNDYNFSLYTFIAPIKTSKFLDKKILSEDFLKVIHKMESNNDNDINLLTLEEEEVIQNEEMLKAITDEINDKTKLNPSFSKTIKDLKQKGELDKVFDSKITVEQAYDCYSNMFYTIDRYTFNNPSRPNNKDQLKEYNDYLLQLINQREEILNLN